MATEIDLPFLPSAAQIRRREFASVRRGYDPDQVRDYLAQVAEQVESLEQELRETKSRPLRTAAGRGADVPPRPVLRGSVRAAVQALTTLLATADEEAEGILADARADAARMSNEARSEADRIRVDAQARAEEARQQGNELLERAKQEADRVLLGLSERRETLVQHLQDMQTRSGRGREGAGGRDRGSRVSSPAEPENDSSRGGREGRRAEARGGRPDAEPSRGHDAARRPTTSRRRDPTVSTAWRACSPTTTALDMPGIPSLELDFDDDSDD